MPRHKSISTRAPTKSPPSKFNGGTTPAINVSLLLRALLRGGRTTQNLNNTRFTSVSVVTPVPASPTSRGGASTDRGKSGKSGRRERDLLPPAQVGFGRGQRSASASLASGTDDNHVVKKSTKRAGSPLSGRAKLRVPGGSSSRTSQSGPGGGEQQPHISYYSHLVIGGPSASSSNTSSRSSTSTPLARAKSSTPRLLHHYHDELGHAQAPPIPSPLARSFFADPNPEMEPPKAESESLEGSSSPSSLSGGNNSDSLTTSSSGREKRKKVESAHLM